VDSGELKSMTLHGTRGHTVQTTDNKLWGLISWASSQAIL